jgi:heme exporter protein D
MSEFFAMGGYAAFIWPAYGVSALLLGGAVVFTVRAYRRARAQLAALEKP